MFTPGNYFYNGIGHVTVKYDRILEVGYAGIIKEIEEEIAKIKVGDGNYCKKRTLLDSMILSCKAVIRYANRYAKKAREMAEKEGNSTRRAELLKIAATCERVPEFGARNFQEACQSFWFVQLLIQTESSGHSISPGSCNKRRRARERKGLSDHSEA